MLVNRVKNVVSLAETLIEFDVTYGRDNHINTAFLTGVVFNEAQMLLLLNPDALIRLSDEVAQMIWEGDLQAQTLEASLNSQALIQPALSGADFFTLYCPEATEQERTIFAKRTAELSQSHKSESGAKTIPIAIMGLAGEYFGMNVEQVKEFIDLPKIMPIPCCPSHILGNLNLRGEIVTLVDLKSTLNLEADPGQSPKTAVIAQVGKTVAGIAIDQLYDILYINEGDISGTYETESHWLQGVTPYNNQMVSILNLPYLLEADLLSVNEMV